MSKPKICATYREEVQGMIAAIEKIFDQAEWMRDVAIGDEKDAFNKVRDALQEAARPLAKLDNSMTRERAAMRL